MLNKKGINGTYFAVALLIGLIIGVVLGIYLFNHGILAPGMIPI